jgi:hypothetical protein
MVSVFTRNVSVGRACAALALAWFGLAVPAAQPAVAQGLFDALFGGGRPRYVRPEPLPPQASSFADPFGQGREYRRFDGYHSGPASGGYAGRGTVFCVRTCDGRYFPLQRHAGASPADLCRSFCPASKTLVFSGGNIASAVAPNGVRYADLDNAYAYRDRVVENCTCNGKDGLGLAQASAVTDPTLRPGDIVATNDGLVNFRGRAASSAEFTPIDPSASAWARKLSEIKVRPAPPNSQVEVAPAEETTATAEKPRRNPRRIQAFR